MKIEANGFERGAAFISDMTVFQIPIYEMTKGDGLNLRPND
jgi:hypothetical protein